MLQPPPGSSNSKKKNLMPILWACVHFLFTFPACILWCRSPGTGNELPTDAMRPVEAQVAWMASIEAAACVQKSYHLQTHQIQTKKMQFHLWKQKNSVPSDSEQFTFTKQTALGYGAQTLQYIASMWIWEKYDVVAEELTSQTRRNIFFKQLYACAFWPCGVCVLLS